MNYDSLSLLMMDDFFFPSSLLLFLRTEDDMKAPPFSVLGIHYPY